MNDNDYEMQVEDLIKAEEIKYELVVVFPYFSHDSTALCYTEGATQQNTQYRLPAEQWCAVSTQLSRGVNASHEPNQTIILITF